MNITEQQLAGILARAVDARAAPILRMVKDVQAQSEKLIAEVERLNAEVAQLTGQVKAIPEPPALPEVPTVEAITAAVLPEVKVAITNLCENSITEVKREAADIHVALRRAAEDDIGSHHSLFTKAIGEAMAKLEGIFARERDRTDATISKSLELLEARNEAAILKALAAMPTPRDGKDGTFTEVAPWLEGKDYPSFALCTHDGGLWQCVRSLGEAPSAEAKGWQLIANGIAEVRVTQSEDLRRVEIHHRMASGEWIATPLDFPVLLDRGTFKRTTEYAKGDVVTHDGSMWIAQRDAPGVPADGDGWRLAVRKGRDGRAAK